MQKLDSMRRADGLHAKPLRPSHLLKGQEASKTWNPEQVSPKEIVIV
ncbi:MULTISPECIES: hypothetical protein [unclassified Sphingobium]|nr:MULTISPECIES: hypothetical protein [unclassified Sphingobium]